jgi:ATP-dependent DNA ligase
MVRILRPSLRLMDVGNLRDQGMSATQPPGGERVESDPLQFAGRAPNVAEMLWRSSRRRSQVPAGFIEPCVPTVAANAPAGPQWIHEVKQDGYRLIAKRGDGVRLLTRNGFDWTTRYPRVVAAIERLRVKSATIDGEAVWLDENGIGDFRKLHSRTGDADVCLFAFDSLEIERRRYP